MKRLGMYVFMMLILVGVFLIPQKSFAAVTQADVNEIISRSTAVLSTIPNVDQYSLGQRQYILKLSFIANDTFKSEEVTQATTPSTLEASILRKYIAYLQDKYSSADEENKLYTKADIAAINLLLNAAETARRVEDGTITQAQADQSNADAKAEAEKTGGIVQKSLQSKCTFFSTSSFTDCIDIGFVWLIKNTLLEIAGFLVWVSANMLNYAIQVGVLGFSQWAPDTLYPIWIIIRQIVSLFIVFAGLWLGFMYIIGRDDKFKQYIPWVVIFALFVNFSYPLTRALIDVSNIISLNIYTSAVGAEPLIGDNNVGEGAGALIMNKLGLQGLVMSATAVQGTDGNILGTINSTPGALMAVVFIIYAAYVFFMATAIIAVRTAVLVFLVIASPILFVDSVIPKLGDEAAKLRKMYFEQLIVAPVFMIMLALTLKFLEVFQSGPLKGAGTGTLTSMSSATSVSTFFNILMMLIMLHIMLKVTKSVSGSAGQMATNALGKVGGFGLGLATGGTGMLARASLGRGAAALRDHSWVTNNQDTFLGRRAYNMTNSLANSTFDARNSKTIASGMSKAGMGMGQGGKMGYEAELKAKIDDRTARYGRIKTENEDGTMNLKGSNAKAQFYNKAGGTFLNRVAVQKALSGKDQEEAKKDNKNISAYNKRTGETRQDYFKNEENQAIRNEMIGQDRVQAGEQNILFDYARMNDQQKKDFYEKTTDKTLQEKLKNVDRELAAAANDYAGTNGQTRQDAYKKATSDQKAVFEQNDRIAATTTDKERPLTYNAPQAHENYTLEPKDSLPSTSHDGNTISYDSHPSSTLSLEEKERRNYAQTSATPYDGEAITYNVPTQSFADLMAQRRGPNGGGGDTSGSTAPVTPVPKTPAPTNASAEAAIA